MTEKNNEQCKLELTLDRSVKNMQAAWGKSRESQLYALHAAVPVLELARANTEDFRVYCQDRSVRGDRPETQVVELMLQNDPDADAITRERRAEYGAAIGWFAIRMLCPETDAEKAVELAKRKGRIKGIANLYRNHKDAQNPEAVAAKEKAKTTKAANGKRGKAEGSYPRAALAKEFGRKLDMAGVVPLSPADLTDLGVSLVLVIHDQPVGQPRMFQIVYDDTGYRRVLDNIIQRHRQPQTTKSAEAA
jgi:hypothetical protein